MELDAQTRAADDEGQRLQGLPLSAGGLEWGFSCRDSERRFCWSAAGKRWQALGTAGGEGLRLPLAPAQPLVTPALR